MTRPPSLGYSCPSKRKEKVLYHFLTTKIPHLTPTPKEKKSSNQNSPEKILVLRYTSSSFLYCWIQNGRIPNEIFSCYSEHMVQNESVWKQLDLYMIALFFCHIILPINHPHGNHDRHAWWMSQSLTPAQPPYTLPIQKVITAHILALMTVM